jgi:peptide/nickel transport system substrate-binding protein
VSGILETYNAATGGGNGNFGRYSNPSIDAKSVLAKQTIDRDARLALLQDATRMAMEDYALIPIHFQVNKWAMIAGLEHNPRTNERTLATEVKRVQ